MTDAAKPNQPTEAAAAPADAKTKWWKSLLTPRWLVVFVAVSLVIHAVIFVLVRRSAARPAIPPEYTVGAFNLIAGQLGDSHGVPGKFELHVRFIDDLQSQANARIANHQFRVREAIENLLRKSHGIELDDQAIARLKHQIQEQIDQAIDLRAVAEVMITDLTIEPLPSEAPVTAVQATGSKEHTTVATSLPDDHVSSKTAATPTSPPSD
jgi:flagellar basal body-associated protein FliL